MEIKKSFAVIMPSFLGNYEGAAHFRENKFVRAVNSFVKQKYDDNKRLLVIISDGCEITKKLYNSRFRNIENIVLLEMPKQILFSGKVRQAGINFVKKDCPEIDYICYLDIDDFIGETHLATLNKELNKKDFDWAFYDEFWRKPTGVELRPICPVKDVIGTSSIVHKLYLDTNWPDGWGHDFVMIQEMLTNYPNFGKLEEMPEYYVCHVKGLFEF